MKRGARGVALSVALLLAALFPPAASAQERATRHDDENEKDAAKRKPRLSLDLGAEEAYESNVPYTQELGIDDYVTRARARLAAALPIRRSVLELGVEGGVNAYRTVKGLDRYTWGIDAAFERRLSRRSDIELRARTGRGFARDNPNVDVAGVLYPLTVMRSDTLEGGWRQRLGRAFDVRLDGRAELYRFESPQQQDGWSAGGRVGFENEFTPRFALGAEGLYGRTATDPQVAVPPLVGARFGQTIEVASAQATARLGLARHVVLRLEGGVARFGAVGEPEAPLGYLPPPAGAPRSDGPELMLISAEMETTPQVAGSLEATFGRHVFTALGSRRIEQSYGVGAIGINRVFSVAYRGQLAPWVALNLIGTDNHNASPQNLVLSSGRTGSVGLDFTMPWQFGARLTYSYWDRHDPFRDWRSHTVAAALSKTFDWR